MISFLRMTLTLPLIALAGCTPRQVADYSPGYSYVATGPTGSEKGVSQSMLVPDACLTEPNEDGQPPAATSLTVVPDVGPDLPSGCANAYNLQRMAERQKDLVEGRHTGPASGAVSARAAKRYLYGEEADALGGANSGTESPPPPVPEAD
jgi:hypothetical protein